MKVLIFFLLQSILFAHSIVFVHLGPNLPSHLTYSLSQARLFNPDIPIYLIGDSEALYSLEEVLRESQIEYIPTHSLPTRESHKVYLRQMRHYGQDGTNQKYWTWTTERLFYLAEFVRSRSLTDIFHIESDVMLYTDLATFLPVFHEHYRGMLGATFENPRRGVLGLLYIADAEPIERFVDYIAYETKSGGTDMGFIGTFKCAHQGQYVEALPVIMREYGEDRMMKSRHNHLSGPSELYTHLIDRFDSLFDGLALGIYLGGVNPLTHEEGKMGPGYVDKQCIFDPTFLTFEWSLDKEKRVIPLASYKGKSWPINNLHIHSKRLSSFYSKNIKTGPIHIEHWDTEYRTAYVPLENY